jgi:hypothetical protein
VTSAQCYNGPVRVPLAVLLRQRGDTRAVRSGTSIAALPQHRKYISMKALCSRLARIWEGGKMDGTLVEIVLEN